MNLHKKVTCLGLLWAFVSSFIFAQTPGTLSLTSTEDGTFKVFFTPATSESVSLMGNSQITIQAPAGGSWLPTSINSVHGGTWRLSNSKTSVAGIEYISFGNYSTSSSISLNAGEQLELFSFKNTGTCSSGNMSISPNANFVISRNGQITDFSTVLFLSGNPTQNAIQQVTGSVACQVCVPPSSPVLSASAANIVKGESSTLAATGCLGTVTWDQGLGTGNSKSVSPTSTTTYTATCTVEGCTSNKESVTITVSGGNESELSCVNLGDQCSGNSTETRSYTLTVPSGGNQRLQLTYRVQDRSGLGRIRINGGNWRTFILPQAAEYQSIDIGSFFLNSGSNTIELNSGGGYLCFRELCSKGSNTSCTPPPAPVLTATVNNLLSGETSVLNATGCPGTISWNQGLGSGGSKTVSPTSTTTYTAICTFNDCTSESRDITIHVTAGGNGFGCIVNKVRLKFRSDCCADRLYGAKIQGSNDQTNWTTLYTIGQNASGNWQEFTFGNTTYFPHVRFVAGPSGFGEVYEVEFYKGNTRLSGTAFGNGAISPAESWQNAVDSNEGTFWHGSQQGTVNYAGLTLTDCSTSCTPPPAPTLTANAATIVNGASSLLTATGCSGGTVTWSNSLGTGSIKPVSPTSTTTYTATCTINECTSESGSVTVTVQASGGNCASGNFSGSFDAANCDYFSGWAIDFNNYGRTVDVEIRIDGILVATVAANQSRSDLINAFGTPQAEYHGWFYAVPSTASWRTGSDKTVSVRICGSTQDLPGSPKTVNCSGGLPCTPPSAPVLTTNVSTINTGQSSTLTATGCIGGTVTWSNGLGTGNSKTVSPTSTTTYTATCTIADCTSENGSVSVTVGDGPCAPPSAPVLTASPSSIVSGASTTLTATGCTGGTVTWSNDLGTGSSKTVSPTSTTTYTATCTIADCTSENGSVSVTVGDGPCTPPSAPVLTASPASIVSGASSTLTATGCTGGTVTWSNDLGTGSSKTVSPTSTTTYTATCTINECTSEKGSVTVTVQTGGGNCASGNFSGFFDGANCDYFNGWAIDFNNYGRTVDVEIRIDGILVATVAANQSRPDLVSAFGTPQAEYHGWFYAVPSTASWRTGSNKTVSVRICGSTQDLPGSPKTVNCSGGVVCTPPSSPVLTASPASIVSGASSTLAATGCTGGTVTWSNGLGTGSSKTVSPTSTTTYTATCTINDCVSSTGSVTVTVQAAPCTPPSSPVLTASPASIVSGASTTLAATGCTGGTVTWSNSLGTGSNKTVSPTSTTTYTATCTINDCVSSTGSVTVTVESGGSSNACIVNKVRLKFRSDCCADRLYGAKIQGSNDKTNWTTIYTINQNAIGNWQEFTFGNTTYFPHVRFVAGPSGFGEVYEVEFYKGNTRLSGTAFGNGAISPAESWQNAVDGNEWTFWHGSQQGAANYAGLTLSGCGSSCTPPSAPVLTASPASIVSGASSTLAATGCTGGTVTWSNGLGTGSSKTVSPTSTTTYTATCTINDCVSSAGSVTVTVQAAPCTPPSSPVLTASPASIVSGASSTLAATGCTGGTVTWSNDLGMGSSKTVSPTSTTTYTATCTINDCVSSTGSVTVTVQAAPCTPPSSPVLTASPASIVSGASSTLTATGCTGGTVTWSNDLGTGSSKTVSPTSTTTYTAICKINDCVSSTGSVTLIVTLPPPTGTPVCVNLGDQCSGNSSEIRSYTMNLTLLGTRELNLTYRAHEKPSVGRIRINGGSWQSFALPKTAVSVYQTISIGAHFLQSGSNTIELSSGDGFVCFRELCTQDTSVPSRIGVIEEEITAPHAFDLYPNPSTGDFQVNFYVEIDRKATLQVVDMLGRTIFTKAIIGKGNHQEFIQLTEQPAGTYLVVLTWETTPGISQTESKRILLNR